MSKAMGGAELHYSAAPGPNKALQATAYSARSSLAPASSRAWALALAAQRSLRHEPGC